MPVVSGSRSSGLVVVARRESARDAGIRRVTRYFDTQCAQSTVAAGDPELAWQMTFEVFAAELVRNVVASGQLTRAGRELAYGAEFARRAADTLHDAARSAATTPEVDEAQESGPATYVCGCGFEIVDWSDDVDGFQEAVVDHEGWCPGVKEV